MPQTARRLPALLSLALSAATAVVGAQTVHIVDLNSTGSPTAGDAQISESMPELGGLVYFSAQSDEGFELWATDGTTGGTYREADLYPGPERSSPARFTEADGRIFFSATSASGGTELWTLSGPGTATEIDVIPGPSSSSPIGLTAFDGGLYIVNGPFGELYRADTTTLAAAAVAPGAVNVVTGPFPGPVFVDDGSLLYFIGEPVGGSGDEVWSSDGTAVGTDAVTSIGCSTLQGLASLGSQVLFLCNTGSGQLLRTDTSSGNGSALLNDFGDSAVSQLTTTSELAFLVVESNTTGNRRIFTYSLITGLITPLPGLANTASPDDLIVFDDGILFTADNGSGRELFWSDGSTVTEFDLRAGAAGSEPQDLVAAGAQAYFTADVGSAGRELWVTDGTIPGTQLVIDLVPGVEGPSLALGSGASFGFLFKDLTSEELWVTDGTTPGTQTIEFPDSFSSEIRSVFPLADGRVAFIEAGQPLQVTDGTVGGTVSLAGPTFTFSEGSLPVVVLPNGRTLFTAFDGAAFARYSTNGEIGSVETLGVSGPSTSDPTSDSVFDGRFFFCHDDGVHGEELWVSDGTAAGTTMLLDLDPAGDGVPCGRDFVILGSYLYFGGNDGSGHALWRTDGTALGTVEIAAVDPFELSVFDGLIYFRSSADVDAGSELWRSDGTNPGTERWIDLHPGPVGSSPTRFLAAGGLLWFDADSDDDGNDHELWRSDGTLAGTFQVHDFADATTNAPSKVAGIAGGLLLNENDSDEDRLLFASGSVGAPLLLGSFDELFTSGIAGAEWEGRIYFRATTAATGKDLWRTDGTVLGTQPFELEPGAPSSEPLYFVANGPRLWMSAYDATARTELHFLDSRFFWDGFESGDTGGWSLAVP